jgi:hypothetical protein
VLVGSGSSSEDGPFHIGAMKKKVQTKSVHRLRFRERKSFTNKSPKALSERTIPAVPQDTARVVRAVFPRGNVLMQLRDTLGTIDSNEAFADLFPSHKVCHPGGPSLLQLR